MEKGGTKMKERSLYDCENARYPTDNTYIHCRAGHQLGRNVHARMMDRGDKLVYKVCRDCPDFIDMNDKEKS